MTLHPRSRHLSRIPFSAMATAVLASVLLLQSCKRAEMGASWTPASASPSAYLEDSVLTSRVKAALLLSPVSHSINIGVESHQGVVLLSGMVANQTQLDLALFVAQNVPGVDKVDSFLFFVKTPPTIVSRTHQLSGTGATGAVSDTPAAAALLQRQRVVDGAAAAPATLAITGGGRRSLGRHRPSANCRTQLFHSQVGETELWGVGDQQHPRRTSNQALGVAWEAG